MLVLTRKIGEKIMIGDQIEVVILGFQGRQVRVGIAAPKSMIIRREELLTQISPSVNAEKETSA